MRTVDSLTEDFLKSLSELLEDKPAETTKRATPSDEKIVCRIDNLMTESEFTDAVIEFAVELICIRQTDIFVEHANYYDAETRPMTVTFIPLLVTSAFDVVAYRHLVLIYARHRPKS